MSRGKRKRAPILFCVSTLWTAQEKVMAIQEGNAFFLAAALDGRSKHGWRSGYPTAKVGFNAAGLMSPSARAFHCLARRLVT